MWLGRRWGWEAGWGSGVVAVVSNHFLRQFGRGVFHAVRPVFRKRETTQHTEAMPTTLTGSRRNALVSIG